MLFQPLKAGQKINRAFFNDLISFCNSLVLRGDGKTTQVTHTAGGTTVSAVIPEVQKPAQKAQPLRVVQGDTPGSLKILPGLVVIDKNCVTFAGASFTYPANFVGIVQIGLALDQKFDAESDGVTPFWGGIACDIAPGRVAILATAEVFVSGGVTQIRNLASVPQIPLFYTSSVPFEAFFRDLYLDQAGQLNARAVGMVRGIAPDTLGGEQSGHQWAGAAIGDYYIGYRVPGGYFSTASWTDSCWDAPNSRANFLIAQIDGDNIYQAQVGAIHALNPTLS